MAPGLNNGKYEIPMGETPFGTIFDWVYFEKNFGTRVSDFTYAALKWREPPFFSLCSEERFHTAPVGCATAIFNLLLLRSLLFGNFGRIKVFRLNLI